VELKVAERRKTMNVREWEEQQLNKEFDTRLSSYTGRGCGTSHKLLKY
jgi:hypothetical protein